MLQIEYKIGSKLERLAGSDQRDKVTSRPMERSVDRKFDTKCSRIQGCVKSSFLILLAVSWYGSVMKCLSQGTIK